MSESCASCRFYLPSAARGVCRRRPPVWTGPDDTHDEGMFAFPSVYPHSWCGEYEHGEEKTNLDAAPAATVGAEGQMSSGAAQPSSESDAQHPSAAKLSQPGDGRDTGTTTQPVAWCVMYPNGQGVDACYEYEDDARMAASSDQEVVPLYRRPN